MKIYITIKEQQSTIRMAPENIFEQRLIEDIKDEHYKVSIDIDYDLKMVPYGQDEKAGHKIVINCNK